MRNQHLPAGMRTSEVVKQAIAELQDFITVCRDAREARIAQGKSSWFILITCTKKSKQF